MATLVAGLELEVGRSAAEGLVQRYLGAEECELCWETRIEERWLGAYEGLGDEEGEELDRVAMLSFLDGAWVVAVCLADGECDACGLTGRRSFTRLKAVREAFASQR
jgi:hypothetical protein